MKQKKLYLVIFFLAFVFLVSPSISLAEGVCFKPEFPIPGFELDGAKDGCPGGKILSSKGDAIILYVNALYKYGAGFAGLMAMFMIVFAAWQWIMASGNAGKIDNAKETIRGALLGLTLLFAGNLLLSNITNRLVSFNGLNIKNITTQQLEQLKYTAKQCYTMQKTECEANNISCQWVAPNCKARPVCNITRSEINKFSDLTCCAKLDVDSGRYINHAYASVPAGSSCGSVCGSDLATDRGLAACLNGS